MCSGTSFPAWQAACLDKLLELDFAEPALLIVDADPRGIGWSRLRHLARYPWYVFNILFAARSAAMRVVDRTDALKGVPVRRCRVVRRGRFSQYFRREDVEAIRGHDLDFILRFGFDIIRGEILGAATYGVWSFHHGDEQKYRGTPPAFWEIYHGDPVTGSILQRLTERLDGGVILEKGHLRTIATSWVRNRDQMYVETASWPARVCLDIRNGNTEHLTAQPSSTTAPIFTPPNPWQMLVFLRKLIQNALQSIRVLTEYDVWSVGIVRRPLRSFLERDTQPSEIEWLSPPDGARFWADPFAIHREGTLHVLVEDFDYRTSTGRISVVCLEGPDLAPRQVAVGALSGSSHMAYPYVFEHQGDIYCVPETWKAREVALFRATEFPWKWAKVATLLGDYAGVDSTLFRHDGRWWLTGTDQDDDPLAKLNVFHADALEGPWRPHARNPVKIDVRGARPAGTPFVHEGQLYRPAQDCSERYGARVVIHRVTRLTSSEFREEPVAIVGPRQEGPYPRGLHTISAAGDLTVLDGVRTEHTISNVPALLHKLRRIRDTLRRSRT